MLLVGFQSYSCLADSVCWVHCILLRSNIYGYFDIVAQIAHFTWLRVVVWTCPHMCTFFCVSSRIASGAHERTRPSSAYGRTWQGNQSFHHTTSTQIQSPTASPPIARVSLYHFHPCIAALGRYTISTFVGRLADAPINRHLLTTPEQEWWNNHFLQRAWSIVYSTWRESIMWEEWRPFVAAVDSRHSPCHLKKGCFLR
jgi:hypothetical protein